MDEIIWGEMDGKEKAEERPHHPSAAGLLAVLEEEQPLRKGVGAAPSEQKMFS